MAAARLDKTLLTRAIIQLSSFYSRPASVLRYNISGRLLCTTSDLHEASDDVSLSEQTSDVSKQKVQSRLRKHGRDVKLHNRVFTEQELEMDKQLGVSVSGLVDDVDSFGSLSKSAKYRGETRKFQENNQSQNNQRSNIDSVKKNKIKDKLNVESLFMQQKQNTNEREFKSSFDEESSEISPSQDKQRNAPRRDARSSFSPQANRDLDDGDEPVMGHYAKRRLKKKWADTFGTLRDEERKPQEFQTMRDVDEKRGSTESDEPKLRTLRKTDSGGSHSPKWYSARVVQFGKEGKIKEALAVVDDWMMKEDRVLPQQYTFTSLIGILGRAGYTSKAFEMFAMMKELNRYPKHHTYTALFNACANCPWKVDGLRRATGLLEQIRTDGHSPNVITYNAMLKAFGIHGDLKTCVALLNELCEHYKPDIQTYSFLLIACCSDKEAGFQHAMQVWKMMRIRWMQPNIYLYNLFLRAVRDCGIGDPNTQHHRLSITDGLTKDGRPRPLLQLTENVSSNTLKNVELLNMGRVENFGTRKLTAAGNKPTSMPSSQGTDLVSLPGSDTDLVSLHGSDTDLVSLPGTDLKPQISYDMIKTPDQRLSLLGGLTGILSHMKTDNVIPDLKTFTQLLVTIPQTPQAESELMEAMVEYELKPDMDFFNLVIMRRNKRGDKDGAKEIIPLLSKYKLHPNIQTFGCLALGCNRRADAVQLLQDIEAIGTTPNVEIFSILVNKASTNFSYLHMVLREMEKHDVLPTMKILQTIETRVKKAEMMVVKQERGKPVGEFYTSSYFRDNYKLFMSFYPTWLRRTKIYEPPHPWEGFSERKSEDEEVEMVS